MTVVGSGGPSAVVDAVADFLEVSLASKTNPRLRRAQPAIDKASFRPWQI